MKDKDTIYSTIIEKITGFEFNSNVADVFDDMITRSVPGYRQVMEGIRFITQKYSKPNSNLYDLGTSTGTGALVMLKSISSKGCNVIAVDNSEPMANKCKDRLNSMEDINTTFDVVVSDLCNIEIKNGSIVLLNYTLQFVEPKKRFALIKKIYDGLLPGGVLLLSEKICLQDKESDEMLIDLHHLFKSDNDYSELEISQKRTALENILIRDTIESHFKRVNKAGFKKTVQWLQNFNFVSIICQK